MAQTLHNYNPINWAQQGSS